MTTFKSIAYQILKEAGKPLHSKKITKRALAQGLATKGKTPEATMNAQLIRDIMKNKKNSRFIKTDPSTFAVNSKYKKPKVQKKFKERLLTERQVQLAVLDYLYKHGWGTRPHIKQKREKGVDIRVQNDKRPSRYFFIETKGESKSKSARAVSEVAFVYSLGQLVTRMKVVGAKYAYNYGLGLPAKSAKIALRRIPWKFAQLVCLYIFSVSANKRVTKYSWQDMKIKQKK